MTLPALPCSELAEHLEEDLGATAPSEARILVVEQSGPWGRDAVSESGLRPHVERLQELADGARIQVVRRSTRRYRHEHPSAWLADVHTRTLQRYALEDLLAGATLEDGEPFEGPLFLACTHSTRDPCCARKGLPMHRALASHGAAVWHASHLGGHRFAATLAILPAGIWLGRVTPEDAPAIIAAAREDRFPVELVRGRAGRPAAAQAAELAVRREYGLEALDDVDVEAVDGDVVHLAGAAGSWTVRVRHEPTGIVRPLSCGAAAKREDPGRWVLDGPIR